MNSGPSSFFPFLRLPGELRNKIYVLCLRDIPREDGGSPEAGCTSIEPRWDTELKVYDHSFHRIGKVGKTLVKLSPQLLQVNKQIYAEAHAVLYQTPFSFFALGGLRTIVGFLTCIGRERTVIRQVQVRIWQHYYGRTLLVQMFEQLRLASSLQKAVLRIYSPYSDVAIEDAADSLLDASQGWFHELLQCKGDWKSTIELRVMVPVGKPPRPYGVDRTLTTALLVKIDQMLHAPEGTS